ncbi:MAG: enoyl-CoA hydratase [Burkholderiales bacterium]
MPEILVGPSGPIARVIISHPERHNALTYEMLLALSRVFAALDDDATTRVVVISGAIDKSFAAGADISQFEALRGNRAAEEKYMSDTDRALLAPMRCKRPVIASIRGYCIGGGLQLAAACDLRIAADDAVFQMPAARLGVGYSFDGIERYVDLIGASNTADLFISARKFGAKEALRMGFVNRVVAAADLDREVDAYCGAVADNAPLTVAAAKAAISEVLKDPARRDMAALQSKIDACWGSHDYHEGRLAFMEKRKARFAGR